MEENLGDNNFLHPEKTSPAREVFIDRLEEINAEFDALQFNIEADLGGGATRETLVRTYRDRLNEVVVSYKSLIQAVEANGIDDFLELGLAINKLQTLEEHFFPSEKD